MEATHTEEQQTPIKAEKSPNLYSSISDLPFCFYVDAVITLDTSQIADWSVIQQEFNDAIGTPSTNNIELISEIEALNATYNLIQLFASLLEISEHQEVTDIVKEELSLLGFEVFDDNIANLLARAESIKMEMDEKIEALQLSRPSERDVKPTKQFYVDLLARISRHFKLPLRMNDKTFMTDEFCAHYKALIEESNRNTPQSDEE